MKITTKSLLKALVMLIVVLLGVSILSFFISYLAPGDPALRYLTAMGMSASPELIESTRESMGLNQPVYMQYLHWLWNALHGDLGISYQYGGSVFEIVKSKLPGTLLLTAVSMALAVIVAVPCGFIAAIHKGHPADHIIRIVTLSGISAPSFWVGLVLMYIFCIRLQWLPSLSRLSGKGIVLPAVTMALTMIGGFTQTVRSAVITELSKDYVKGALIRGIPFPKILLRDVLPNIGLTLLSVFGLYLGGCLGGSSIIESIFTYPGVGYMVVDAIGKRDYTLIQGFVVWMAFVYVIINFIVDILVDVLSQRYSIHTESQ